MKGSGKGATAGNNESETQGGAGTCPYRLSRGYGYAAAASGEWGTTGQTAAITAAVTADTGAVPEAKKSAVAATLVLSGKKVSILIKNYSSFSGLKEIF